MPDFGTNQSDSVETFKNKTIQASLNTITGLLNASIGATAAIDWSKISKTGSSLDDLSDVNISLYTDGMVLMWDATNSRWDVGATVPTTATYLTLSTNPFLSNERVLTTGTNISFTDGGAGTTLTVNVPNASTTVKGAAELATDGESAANVVVQGNDSRLSNSRTPTAHKDSHKSGGTDPFTKTDVIAAPSRYLEEIADPASDSGRIWINSNSQAIEYWDTTTGTPVQRTVANLLSTQSFQNKNMDASLNTFSKVRVAPYVRDTGDLLITFGGVVGKTGIMANLSSVGTVTAVALNSTEGFGANMASAGTANSLCGQNSQPMTYRAWSPYLRMKFNVTVVTANVTSLFLGFLDTATQPTTDTFIGTGLHGLGIGFRTTDTNWMVFTNDGSGTMGAATLGTGTAKDTGLHAVEFQFDNSVPNCVINFYGTSGLLQTATVTTDLPGSTTALTVSFFSRRTDTTANNTRLYNGYMEHTRTSQPL